jgi:hypothetical protein
LISLDLPKPKIYKIDGFLEFTYIMLIVKLLKFCIIIKV